MCARPGRISCAGESSDVPTLKPGYSPSQPDSSLYLRALTDGTLPMGPTVQAWVYFYNAPLGQAQRIISGDYLEYIASR